MLRLAIVWLLITGGLKLGGVIAWSWWIVVGPALVMVALLLVLFLCVSGAVLRVVLGPRRW